MVTTFPGWRHMYSSHASTQNAFKEWKQTESRGWATCHIKGAGRTPPLHVWQPHEWNQDCSGRNAQLAIGGDAIRQVHRPGDDVKKHSLKISGSIHPLFALRPYIVLGASPTVNAFSKLLRLKMTRGGMAHPDALAQHRTVICIFTPEVLLYTRFIPLIRTHLPGLVKSGIPLSSALKTSGGLSRWLLCRVDSRRSK